MRRATQAAIRTWLIRGLVLVAAVTVAQALRASYLRGSTPGLEGQLGVRAFEVARVSFLRGDGFPLFDRSQCGGSPYLGNPDTTVLGALFAGLFGVRGDVMVRGYLLLAAVLAITGTYAWARRALLVDRLPAFMAGVVFAAAGGVVFHGGFRLHFAAVALLPWVLAFVRMGERDVRAIGAAGLALGVVGLEGGLYPLAFTMVALVLAELPRVAARDGGAAAVGRVVGLTLALGLAIASLKLVPMMDLLARYPRVFAEKDAPQWPHFFAMLGEAEINRPAGVLYSADEYRGYVGPLAIGMGIAGAGTALILKPRRVDVFFLLVGALVLARGASGPHAPFVLLSRLPLFHQLNVPSRWVIVVDLAIAGAAAIALHEAVRAVRRPHLVAVLLAAGLLAAADPLSAARKLTKDLPQTPALPKADPPVRPYHLEAGLDDLARKAENPMRNLGTDSCYSLSLELPPARGLRMGEVPQAWIDAGVVKNLVVRQNAWVLDVEAPVPSVVHFNQTFGVEWKSEVGRVQRNPLGMLDLAVPAGRHHLVVAYRPRGFWTGIALSTIGSLGALLLLAWPWLLRRRRRT